MAIPISINPPSGNNPPQKLGKPPGWLGALVGFGCGTDVAATAT